MGIFYSKPLIEENSREKKRKTKENKRKNIFIDVLFKFKYDFGYTHKVSEEEKENSRRFVRFYEKPLLVKQEIKLNDFLKKELRKCYVKIKIEIEDKNRLTYHEFTNILERNWDSRSGFFISF